MKTNWHSFLAQALSWIGAGSAALAGASGHAIAALPESGAGAATPMEPIQPLVFERANHNDGLESFAAHSSHASHASHASHSSHYSGSGGAAADPSLTPSPPATTAGAVKPTIGVSQQDKQVMVMRVQAQLHVLGYYTGTIDGNLGNTTKDALRRYQLVKGLPATSAMDDATLASLGIVY
jgi:putative peptidoglycan binding protein